jgi:hypothetical protein
MALGYALMHAELQGLICSGVPRGRQHTYALLDERVPAVAAAVSREEMLRTLTERYFTAHGPATLADFTWWSTLTVADARLGLALCGSAFESEEIEGTMYWHAPHEAFARPAGSVVHLLQGYDEYFVGYSGKSKWVLDASRNARAHAADPAPFTHVLVANSQVAGRWRRAPDKDRALVELQLFQDIDETALTSAVERYGRFLDLPADHVIMAR